MSDPWGASTSPLTESAFFNAARPTVVLLVESGSDYAFWRARVHARCEVRDLGGRERALEEAARAREERDDNVIAILDADFDRIEGRLAELSNVFWTDHHDLEVMLILSPALGKVLAERGAREKLGQLRDAEVEVRQRLLELGLCMARLRLASQRQGWGLKFRKRPARPHGEISTVKVEKFCPPERWELDVARMIQVVIEFNQRHDLLQETERVRQVMETMPDEPRDQLCNGHDLVALLAVGLKKKLGSGSGGSVDVDDLTRDLRLAHEMEHLMATGLYAALTRWQARRPACPLLPKTPPHDRSSP